MAQDGDMGKFDGPLGPIREKVAAVGSLIRRAQHGDLLAEALDAAAGQVVQIDKLLERAERAMAHPPTPPKPAKQPPAPRSPSDQ